MLRPRAPAHSPDTSSRQVRERGKKVLANIIAQQEGLITRPHFKAFVRKLGTQAVPKRGRRGRLLATVLPGRLAKAGRT